MSTIYRKVGKIRDSQETAKSQIVWDFPDIWKPGFIVCELIGVQANITTIV